MLIFASTLILPPLYPTRPRPGTKSDSGLLRNSITITGGARSPASTVGQPAITGFRAADDLHRVVPRPHQGHPTDEHGVVARQQQPTAVLGAAGIDHRADRLIGGGERGLASDEHLAPSPGRAPRSRCAASGRRPWPRTVDPGTYARSSFTVSPSSSHGGISISKSGPISIFLLSTRSTSQAVPDPDPRPHRPVVLVGKLVRKVRRADRRGCPLPCLSPTPSHRRWCRRRRGAWGCRSRRRAVPTSDRPDRRRRPRPCWWGCRAFCGPDRGPRPSARAHARRRARSAGPGPHRGGPAGRGGWGT